MMLNQRLSIAATALSAFLLFLVQPMLAKELLPVFGGASAVWIACLVFFQIWLLAGYAYADWLTRLAAGRQARVHGVLLAAAALSLLVHGAPTHGGGSFPSLAIFLSLLKSVGLPYLALASTTPLLQNWWMQRSGSKVPYGWFALSNLASLLALLLYPWKIEPRLNLTTQFDWWSGGFVLFAGMCGVLAWQRSAAGADRARTDADLAEEGTAEPMVPSPVAESGAVSRWRRVLWVLLPMCSSMMLCSTTTHLTQDVAAIPLLWVLPLAVYLITFILTFEGERFYSRLLVPRLLALMVASMAYSLFRFGIGFPLLITLPLFLLGLFAVCWFCHGELYRLRPRTGSPTRFYLYVAAGGALGAIFSGIVAPAIFTHAYELSVTLAMVSALALVLLWEQRWSARMLWAVCVALMIYVPVKQARAYSFDSLAQVRNFYGSLRVTENHNPPGAVTTRHLFNGIIEHGIQIFSDALRREPTSYYARDSGVGLALENCCGGGPRRVGVVGLGVGTLAAYGHAGDTFRFYEINPEVERLARAFFTFLRDTPATVKIVPGDARISLTSEPPENYDVLVIDAFSGDAIPVHLLTREAVRVYLRHLKPGGILAFHVSNQHLDLAPVVGMLAEDAGMHAVQINSHSNKARGEFAADWVLLTRNPAVYLNEDVVNASEPITRIPGLRLWTDNDNSLLPLLKVPVVFLPGGGRY